MKAVLTVTGGPQRSRQWTIDSDEPLTIGRGSDADLVLLDSEISRSHCRVSCTDGRWHIEDNSSLNGVFVNGRKVAEDELRHGDTIRVGSTGLRFDIAAEAVVERAPEVPVATGTCSRCGREIPSDSETCPVCGRKAPFEALGVAEELTQPAALKEEPVRLGEPRRPAAPPEVVAAPRVVRIEQENTVQEFIERHPHDTSNIVLTRRQKLWYLLVIAAFILLLNVDYLYFLQVVHLLCMFYLVVIAYKLVTIFLSVVKKWEIQVQPHEIAAFKDAELPMYTILVPLYKETEVVNKIVRHISEFDYPKDKLDVKILLEPDDPGTLEAIQQTGLPGFCEVIVCPDSKPKTKPKACNHGLARARGRYTVIYDAEDRPEPDQLKKAVAGFRKAEERWEKGRWLRRLNPFARAEGGRPVCLQAKLNYYNPDQNLLTRWFTIEYATWYQLYLPGLHALRAPIPLGGTSNHFRTDMLQEIGGWDPFNVTEDCDLGIRIHKLGYRTRVLDSTTWEEANSQVGNWVRQRSRWVKGYIQTHFTHMRHPLRTLWKLHPLGMFHFLNSVGGLSVMLLLNPIFWLSSLLYVGLFTMDLHEHGYSFEKALGVEEAFRDATDPDIPDRTVRIPHPSRWAWPIICGALPDVMPPKATWKQKVWSAIKEDWRHTWHGSWAPPPPLESRDFAAGEGPLISPPAYEHDPWREMWAHRGFHFWNMASQVFFVVTIVLVVGNFFFMLIHVVACLRAGMPKMIPLAIVMPLYWVLISVGAWKGFLQLFRRPFYWEKTQHGLDLKAAKGQ